MENKSIYFVGAGSGAEDLITLRGHRLICQADMIVYAGSLVNPALLRDAKESCEIYNSAYMNLEEMIDIMIRGYEENKLVVRLQTGDTSLYGAVREQMDSLKARGIPYEVCPGVSSFCGAAAALKAEYTLPDVSQTVIITRMEGRTGGPQREKLSLLAEHHATMVIFLSAALAEQVQQELLEGYEEDTSCAVVYKATWPEEKIVRGELKNLAQMIKDNKITKTALIMVGDFLGDEYQFSKLYDKEFETAFRKGEESL